MRRGLRLTVASVAAAALCVGCDSTSTPPPAGDDDAEKFTLWMMDYDVDGFTDKTSMRVHAVGEEFRLELSMGCDFNGNANTRVRFHGLNAFHPVESRVVALRWDGGEVETRTFEVAEGARTVTLTGTRDSASAFMREVAAHQELRIRVQTIDGEFVSDTFGLDGHVVDDLELPLSEQALDLPAAITKLDCASAAHE